MEKNRIPGPSNILYKKKCRKCGNVVVVYTQRDNGPEYYTTVYVPCYCGNYLEFSLPVN